MNCKTEFAGKSETCKPDTKRQVGIDQASNDEHVVPYRCFSGAGPFPKPQLG
jgi:hypothetical protein